MIKTIQDLITEFNKEIEHWRKTQADMEIELKNPVAQLEKSQESPASIQDQAEDKK